MSEIMKDSGIEWIGHIPSSWKLQRLKNVLVNRNENNTPIKTDFILSLTNTRGVIPYSEKGEMGNKSKEDITGYKLAYPDDIVLNSMNVVIGSVGLSNYFGAVSPVYYILYLRNKEDDIRYYNYIFQSNPFQKSLRGYGNGILEIRMRIPINNLNNVMLPIPTHVQQQAIADYLDVKCACIDGIVENQRQIIERLKEYKKSVITEAVTRGLNPDALMKDSGIEWIGKIPEHWEATRTKYTANSLEKGNGITKDDVVLDGGIQCIRYGEIYSKYNTQVIECVSATNINQINTPKQIYKGDILFAGTGELIEEIGKNVVYMGNKPCLAGGDIVILKPNQNPVFLNYALGSTYAQAQKSFAKIKLKVVHISADAIGNIRVALPPSSEQQEIADYLDKKCAEIDSIVEKRERMIELMTEYKKSLIYECVTGKKEIVDVVE